MINVTFRGLEIQTPLGVALAIGHGRSVISGECHFTGLAILLPFGRLTLGWRISENPEPEIQLPWFVWFRHLVWAVAIIVILLFVSWISDIDKGFIAWVAVVWGAILALHLLQILLDWATDYVRARWPRKTPAPRPRTRARRTNGH